MLGTAGWEHREGGPQSLLSRIIIFVGGSVLSTVSLILEGTLGGGTGTGTH